LRSHDHKGAPRRGRAHRYARAEGRWGDATASAPELTGRFTPSSGPVHAPRRTFSGAAPAHDAQPVGGLAKRTFDFVVAATALLVLAPVLLSIAALIMIDSKGSPIFLQERGGFGGRRFMIWKFRTMTVCESHGDIRVVQRLDPCFTRVGKFLRRLSIDELPQLVNILIGDMSLVGPRPHATAHDVEYAEQDPRYLLRAMARPGLTGLAQVSGSRGPIASVQALRERTRLDLEYAQHWSFKRDLGILVKTLMTVWTDPEAF
jgi:lipopolysaccharide/colanic/teichoic acid biosynthesis glycosyltransferase